MAKRKLFGMIVGWFGGLVQEVPDHLAVCEFDCEVLDCRIRDWRECSKLAQRASGGVQRTVVPRRHRRPATRAMPQQQSHVSEITPLRRA